MMKKIFFCLWISLVFLFSPIPTLAYGGGYYVSPAPSADSNSLIINGGVSTTSSTSVALAISANGVSQMAISNTPDFLNVSWEAYSNSKTWILPTGSGTKTVYIKFKSSDGAVSSVISKSIALTEAVLQNQPDINGDNKVNDYDFSILMSNWGTPKNTAADLNKDGKVDDFDFSILISKWSK